MYIVDIVGQFIEGSYGGTPTQGVLRG